MGLINEEKRGVPDKLSGTFMDIFKVIVFMSLFIIGFV